MGGALRHRGPARTLFASADVDAVKRLHPENPRLQQLSEGDRLIVSEPFADLPGLWHEIPEATAVCARRGGALEERPSCLQAQTRVAVTQPAPSAVLS